MSAIIAVGGTLLGTGLGAALAFLRDRAQWSREDAVRWHESKLDAYTRFLNAARDIQRLGVVAAASSVKHSRSESPLEPAEYERSGWDRWVASHDVLREQRSTLELVGPQDVVFAAERLTEALDDYVRTLVEKYSSVPRVPGDEVSVGDVLYRGAKEPKIPPPDPAAARAAEIAITDLRDAFDAFVDATRDDLEGGKASS